MNQQLITAPHAPVVRVLLHLAWPLIFAGGVVQVTGAVVHIFVGQMVGVAGLSIMAMMAPIEMLLGGFFQAVPRGSSVMIARAVGGKRGDGMNLLVTGLSLQLAIALVGTSVVLIFLDPLAHIVSSGMDVSDQLRRYITPWILALPPAAAAGVLYGAIEATGQTRWRLVLSLAMSAITVGAMPVFISSLDLGIAGPPTVTLVLQLINCSLAAFVILRWAPRLGLGRLDRSRPIVDWKRWGSMMAIGGPTQIARSAQFIAIAFLARLASGDGEVATAAFGISLQILFLGGVITIAISLASGIMIGQNAGARHRERALRTLRASLALGAAVGLSVCFLPFFRPLVSLFSDDIAVIETSLEALSVMRWALLGIAVTQTLLTSFEALGSTAVAGLALLVADAIGLASGFTIGPSLDGATWGLTIAALSKACLLACLIPFSFLRPLRAAMADRPDRASSPRPDQRSSSKNSRTRPE